MESCVFLQVKGRRASSGIEVLDDWWDTNREWLSQTGLIKAVNDDRFSYGRAELTLSILPAEAIWVYHTEWNEKSDALIDIKAKSLG